jgi:hypothetical protein
MIAKFVIFTIMASDWQSTPDRLPKSPDGESMNLRIEQSDKQDSEQNREKIS